MAAVAANADPPLFRSSLATKKSSLRRRWWATTFFIVAWLRGNIPPACGFALVSIRCRPRSRQETTMIPSRRGYDGEDAKEPMLYDEAHDYRRKLEIAKAAVEAAERARDKCRDPIGSVKDDNILNRFRARRRKRDASGAPGRIEYTDAGTMIVSIPPSGTSLDSLSAVFVGALWFAAIVPATVSDRLPGKLVFLPFWLAGGLVAKKGVFDPYASFQLSIGRYAWSFQRSYLRRVALKEGATEKLRSAVVASSIVENGVSKHELQLCDDAGEVVASFGFGLPLEELQFLAEEINHHMDIIEEDTV